MKRVLSLLLILVLFLIPVSFADNTEVEFYVFENQTTEIIGNSFLENQNDIVLMAVNPQSISEGVTAKYQEDSPVITYTPKKDFTGTDILQYYFIDDQLRNWTVTAKIVILDEESKQKEIESSLEQIEQYILKINDLIKKIESLQ